MSRRRFYVLLSAVALVAARARGRPTSAAELQDGVSRNYTNWHVFPGCFPPGNNLDQRTNSAGRFPLANMQACSAANRCKGFHLYLLPGDTPRTVYIEYKSSCHVLPRQACAPPMNRPVGGTWHAFRHETGCPPLGRASCATIGSGICSSISASTFRSSNREFSSRFQVAFMATAFIVVVLTMSQLRQPAAPSASLVQLTTETRVPR
mmetsp:Transcript_8679/g.23885  ORF Transcript_8679/g.23885 Transcript_8679/m.23885 type:complete len:207 (-) Transcript_8679:365-985(-)